ncbi:classical arabinogalactan protein 26 [Phoenix dactylifera]|uniref:Classical arabinogalactan protein 26 n=1 Tax=Phoenix dactylifera TaxID=42345 RepID=A0A8B7CCE3_PHODC|nr:classical arabinogalactan protein 26 [Phoenix dactylifera]
MATTTTTSLTPFSTLTHTQLLFTLLAALLLLTNPVSDVSAVPAFLPVEPTASSIPPTLAPDKMPLLPSPGGNAGAAPAGALPTVPSSPSPPDPDKLQPNSAIAPSGSAAVTSVASSLGNLGKLSMDLVCGLVLMWWLEFMDK